MSNQKREQQGSFYPQRQTKKTTEAPDLGKLPPQAIDLEEAVLGACMIEYNAYETIAYMLTPECFYKEVNQIIYKAIETLSAHSKPIDILTVSQQLKSTNELELVGGPYHITTLTNRVSSAANISYHAMIVFQNYVLREMIRLSSQVIQSAFEADYDEASMAYVYATETIDNLMAGKRSDKSMMAVMRDHSEELQRRISLKNIGEMTGIKTGFVDLNRITNGWKAGELIIVAGRPGMGKTAVALNGFTKSSAKAGKNTLFFSLEMDDISLADRLVCSYGGLDQDSLKTGRLSNEDLLTYNNARTQLEKLPIYIDDSARVSIKHITTISRAKRRKGECDMIVIDYLQLIEIPEQRGYGNFKNREREVAEMSRALKLLAKELKIPVMLLCQLNRAVESRTGNKRPTLADLRESGAIEQDADMVIFPYRPEYYGIIHDDAGNSVEGVMLLILAKNRNGRTGDVICKYNPNLTQFFDLNIHETTQAKDDLPY
jgi:replicative DNA helicase